MQLVFTQEYLFNLYHNQATDKHHRFQPEVIKKYIKVVNIFKNAKTVEDLFPFNSLNYEKLSGDKSGVESVRITDKYRLEFRTEKIEGEDIVVVCNILELSNHYQ
ncbi:MAG: type II toxin-antitoxin system RelE/ParE family toxin [Bacteroidales bacterium]|nr:type II toxin-antitoxin system RelE/ParE family toxin [Bacteroidales bacterium]